MADQPRAPITVTFTKTFDPEEMARRGRIGAFARLAKHDAKELTAAGRKAFLDRFEKEVDPDRTLPPAERARRAEFAKKAYFSRLARQSVLARQKKATTDGGSAVAEGGR